MTHPAAVEGEAIFVEPRWPIALTLSAYITITLILRVTQPHREALGPNWLVPGIEVALLAALVAANPIQVGKRSRWLTDGSTVLLFALVAMTLLSTGVLVLGLIQGSEVTKEATSLLASGVLIWLGNALAFGLLYWRLDSGGPLPRYLHERPYPDFVFPQQLSPELAKPGWRPKYVDYLILGLTTSTAFSPTDVLPMAAWAKLTMALQSLVSLVVVGLVIARAVNIFS